MASTRAFATLLQNNGRDDNRAIYTDSVIPNAENNLSNWLVRLEITNTGISAVNTGILTLRIDDVGTFVRTGPILVDENTKNNYLVELQLKQDLAGDGTFSSDGIIVRGIIGSPTITINQSMGEILKIPITSLQYHLKEQVSSKWLLFKTPREAFEERVEEIGRPNGFLRATTTNNLPTRPQLTYKPSGPSILYDEMANIIDGLSNPQVTGGSFDDFYFDIEPSTTKTNYINITADVFGTVDSGVVIDPISLEPQDTDEENTTITDNIVYKNNVIMIGSPNGGSLPVDRTRFASNFEHAKIRDFWATGQSYKEGDLVKLETPTPSSLKPFLITYHKALIDHTSSNTNNPITSHGTIWEVDFTDIPPYISGAYYARGEIISVQSGTNLSFYQANNGGTHSTPSNSDWNLILIKPLPTRNSGVLANVTSNNYKAFATYTPYTNNADVWKQTLAGRANAPSGFEGWAWDWNITKANYNRQDMTNHYEPISAKVVTSMDRTSATNILSDRNNYDGNRYVVPTSGTSGSWVGKGNYVAEWDDSMTGSDRWQFSNAPVNSDVVNDLKTASIYRYNGTSNSWARIWDPLNVDDNDKPAPFHLVKNVGLVAGATGIAGQAIQFTYDWTVIIGGSGTQEPKRTSRGLWICNSTLLPRLDTTSVNVGGLYGGNGTARPSHGTIDTNNLDTNSKGIQGWNNGIDDEDLGKLSTFTFKIKASMYADVAGTILVEGVPEVPMTFWAIDKFDRVWFKKFKARRNGQWDEVKIPVGEMAQNNLYFARWDELSLLLDGVPLTEWDFTLKEKEFSGVNFDWKFMKWWGIQLNEANVDSGLYKNGHQRAFEYGEDVLADISANWYWNLLGPAGQAIKRALPRHTPITQNLIRSSAKIALDDLHFEKEQLVTSDDTSITNPRTSIEYVSQEPDYLNLKSRAIASQARKRFFPQTTHIRSTGDVRLRFGKHFKVKGSRVLENPNNFTAWSNGNNYSVNSKVSYNGYSYQALKASTSSSPKQPDTNSDYWENLNKYSISTVRHFFDHDGYHCEIAGFRKFVVSG